MKMRCIIALLVLLSIIGTTFAQDSEASHQPVTLTILHLNDTHSTFLSSMLSVSFPPDSVVYRLPCWGGSQLISTRQGMLPGTMGHH